MKKLFGKAICVVALVLVFASLMLTVLINGNSVYARTTSLTMDHNLSYTQGETCAVAPLVSNINK
ncbi:MAG: hypothetical protein IKB42_02205 [Clostridia bacterium]|nr:hypothetical protein [Clostridia bacterium]